LDTDTADHSSPHHSGAMILYSEAIVFDPHDYSFSHRDNSLMNSNLFAQAIQYHDQEIELDPKSTLALFNRGNAFLKQNHLEQAVRDFTQAIALDASQVEAFNNRGIALIKYHQLAQAIGDLNRSIALQPTYEAAFNNRGVAYLLQNQLENSINDFSQAIALYATVPDVLVNRGIAFMKLNRLDRAIDDFNQAIELFSESIEAFINRGFAHLNKNQLDRAIDDFNQAIAINGNDGRGWLGRGMARARHQEYLQQAKRDFARAQYLLSEQISSNPPNAWLRLHNAQAHRCLALLSPAGIRAALLDQASSELVQAQVLNPAFLETSIERGLVRVLSGFIDHSWENFEVVTASIPQRTCLSAESFVLPLADCRRRL